MSAPLLVSIITPSFNQARFLASCLRSVECQTYPHIEHIVCDGGSTDGSVGLLEGSAARWVSEPDQGQADAVNKGFAMATGAIIGWINSDDALFARNTIQIVVDAFTSHPSADVVFGHAALVSEDGLILRHSLSFSPRMGFVPRSSSPISQPAAFFRRQVFAEGDPLDTSLVTALDLDLMLRLRAEGRRFCRVPEVLAMDRDHHSRKLRTLAHVYSREAPEVVRRYGYRYHSPALERAFAWTRRLRGLLTVISWSEYESAAPWYVDSLVTRALRQLTTSHRALSRGGA